MRLDCDVVGGRTRGRQWKVAGKQLQGLVTLQP